MLVLVFILPGVVLPGAIIECLIRTSYSPHVTVSLRRCYGFVTSGALFSQAVTKTAYGQQIAGALRVGLNFLAQ